MDMLRSAACCATLSAAALSAATGAPRVLFDFESGPDPAAIAGRDVTVGRVAAGDGKALQLETGTAHDWPGIDLPAPRGGWDLSRQDHVAMDVVNRGKNKLTVCLRVDNPGANGTRNCNTGTLVLTPGNKGELTVPFARKPPGYRDVKIIGMRAGPPRAPRGALIDPANVVNLVVFVPRPKAGHRFLIDTIRAGGTFTPPPKHEAAAEFFPFIDELGQYIHKDWPGKTRSVEQLRTAIETEAKDRAAHPGPADRNRYGGWTAGPKLEATGFFRVEKHRGKWWLVDPEGRLFWSHGIDCVRPGNATPITDRRHYFRDLPAKDSPLGQFYGRGSWAPHGYYRDHSPYETYDFSRANFLRKYGKDWREQFSAITHKRLRSWGLNTIANWSDAAIYLQRKTPYVGTIHFGGRKLAGSKGYWGKFRDVFDTGFRAALAKRLAKEKDRTAGDPWCIGYFIDNELGWGNETSLAVATLQSPPDQPAKKVFVDDLEKRYGAIDTLNAAWGTTHASWDALLESRTPPDKNKAAADLKAFYTKTAETYFRTIRQELKKVAPDQLYLGCRFAWVNDRAALAATKYCDVVGYNRYRKSVADLKLPGGADKPIIIGEFHFGALDRGMFHTGLVKARDQDHRAALYESYVRGALKNPQIVGTHWFQHKDQATTGRGDGENYQIGFIDICDRPYPEIVAAARRVGAALYAYRME